jgi:hypothetical protein
MEKVGIENLKEAVVFLALLGNAVDKSTKDGLSWEDAGLFVQPLMAAPKAFENIGQVSDELKDLDGAELQEVMALIGSTLSLEDKDLDAVTKKALATIVDIYGLVQEIKALRA